MGKLIGERLQRSTSWPSPLRHAALATGTIAIALAAGLTACGDDGDERAKLSKQEYIARSAAICTSNGKRADAAIERILKGAPPSQATAHRFVSDAVVPIFRDSVSKRGELPAPEGDEQQIEALNRAGKVALVKFERIASEPSRSMALMEGKLEDPAKDYDARSRRYGITECGGDNG